MKEMVDWLRAKGFTGLATVTQSYAWTSPKCGRYLPVGLRSNLRLTARMGVSQVSSGEFRAATPEECFRILKEIVNEFWHQ